jgi:hypothetical protein
MLLLLAFVVLLLLLRLLRQAVGMLLLYVRMHSV